MKNILVINGNPVKNSLSEKLANAYCKGALEAGADCEIVNLVDLSFNPLLIHGYKQRTELEPDLIMMREKINKANHLVFVYPTWWGTYPALLKGFIDRLFLPGWAFRYRENSRFWDKLLRGKSAHLITTMDAPLWFYNWIYGKPGDKSLKIATLKFCGVSPVKVSKFSPVKTATEIQLTKWISKVEKYGRKMV